VRCYSTARFEDDAGLESPLTAELSRIRGEDVPVHHLHVTVLPQFLLSFRRAKVDLDGD
jgi:hypothetical protein